MSGGYTLSKQKALCIFVIWIVITISIALMVAYIPDHSCHSNFQNESFTDETHTQTITPVEDLFQEETEAEAPWLSPLLNQFIRPIHYELYHDPDFYYDGDTFIGREYITINVGIRTKHIVVHYKDINITHTAVYLEDKKTNLKINRTFSYDTNEYWVTSLEEAVAAGTIVILHVEFQGSLVNGKSGYYKNTYINGKTGEQSWICATMLHPVYARKAFPCFDEPQYKANFTITQRHWRNFTALSNMPIASETILDYIWQVTTFVTSVKMSSYLVCFIICDFAYKSDVFANGIQHRIWATPDKIDHADFSLNISESIVDYYKEEFGMGYHLPKLDQIAIPGYPAAAMEHWGLITYRERNLLYDEQYDDGSMQHHIAEIVAHELAHDMFGNAITSKWWNDTWLNEGFATYVSENFFHNWKGMAKQADHFVCETMQIVMQVDATVNSRSITEDVIHANEIRKNFLDNIFNQMVYYKGAFLLRMVDHFLGGTKFRDAIRILLKRHEYDSVTTEDLWKVLQEQAGEAYNIAKIMDPWIRQKGLPVITVTQNSNKIMLRQSRFLYDSSVDPDLPLTSFKYKWYVPVSYKTSSMFKENVVWLNMTDAEMEDPRQGNEWIKFNNDQFGYFRVNYESEMWADIAEQLLDNHTIFSETDRSNLIDDAFNLARAGQLNYTIPLNLIKYIEKEGDYFPWRSACIGLGYVSSQLLTEEHYGHCRIKKNILDETKFSTYMQAISIPLMKKLQVENKDNDTDFDRLSRETIILPLLCGYGNEECLNNATKIFLKWLKSDNYTISPIRRGICCYGLQQTRDDDVWNIVWQRYLRSKDLEKDTLAYCLAQTKSSTLIKQYLEYAMNPQLIDSQDFFSIIKYATQNKNAKPHVWDWIQANYARLVDRFGKENPRLIHMVTNIVSEFNTEEKLAEVFGFYKQFVTTGLDIVPVDQFVASIQANINWVKRNRDDILNWLDENFEM